MGRSNPRHNAEQIGQNNPENGQRLGLKQSILLVKIDHHTNKGQGEDDPNGIPRQIERVRFQFQAALVGQATDNLGGKCDKSS